MDKVTRAEASPNTNSNTESDLSHLPQAVREAIHILDMEWNCTSQCSKAYNTLRAELVRRGEASDTVRDALNEFSPENYYVLRRYVLERQQHPLRRSEGEPTEGGSGASKRDAVSDEEVKEATRALRHTYATAAEHRGANLIEHLHQRAIDAERELRYAEHHRDLARKAMEETKEAAEIAAAGLKRERDDYRAALTATHRTSSASEFVSVPREAVETAARLCHAVGKENLAQTLLNAAAAPVTEQGGESLSYKPKITREQMERELLPLTLLANLVAGLDATKWSIWQTTAYFQEELDAAREFLGVRR